MAPSPPAVSTARSVERAKWLRQEVLGHLEQLQRDQYLEIIVRDVARRDRFPEVDPYTVGISPWFKVELHDLYHKGIEVFLSASARNAVPVRDQDGLMAGWRFLREGEEAEYTVRAVAIGRIPFDFIETIDWHPDPYWACPQFYCRFANAYGEPYEDVIFRAKLYPEVSNSLHILEGLREERFTWGPLRR